jgi:uncharacterized membrane protein
MDDERVSEQLRQIEERLSRIEQHLDIHPPEVPAYGDHARGPSPAASPKVPVGEEREYELGQNWFAKVGIVVLALGIVFLLTLPYGELPSAVPGLFGYLLGGGLFLMARLLRNSFDLVSRYLRGAGMVLLFFATMRLFYFGEVHVLAADSPVGILLLVSVLALNLAISLRRKSPYLFNLTLTTGFATAIAVGSGWFLLPMIVVLSVISVVVSLRQGWTTVLVYATALAYLTHLIWALNNPFLGNEMGFLQGPEVSLYLLLIYAAIFSVGALARKEKEKEEIGYIIASFLNGGGSYGVYLLHSAMAFQASLIGLHLAASALFLTLAIVFWLRVRSRFSTFAYVMLGYMALSVAIVRAFAIPELFVWLSVQSLIVVATAIWFRSRFIIVANFVIYLSIAIAYLVVGGEETGISLGFGIVALASARILSWQKDRLELKTEVMRNAYLLSAFAVFPYAASHLVPGEYVSLAWLGIAGFYYLMNMIVRSVKYRWMGHSTILLTVFYVLFIGIAKLPPTYRIVSFLVLGTVLLIGSLIFTRIRARKRGPGEEESGASGGVTPPEDVQRPG